MECNKWTTSKTKADLYNKYRAKWLEEHGFNFVDIYKKFNEYLQKNGLEASNESFDKFQDEYNEIGMWLQFWDWESEVLIPKIRDGILSLIDDKYELVFNISTIYLSNIFEDVSIAVKSIGADKESLDEMAFDIAEAIVNYEHNNAFDDTIFVAKGFDDNKRSLDKMVAKVIHDAYYAFEHDGCDYCNF